MKTTQLQQSVMGITVLLAVPATLTDLIEWAGGEEAVFNAALKNILYRGFSPALREAFAERLESETGLQRRGVLNRDGSPKLRKEKQTDENGNEVVVEVPVLETEQDFYNHCIAEGKIDPARAAALMQEIADGIDPKPQPGSGRKPSKAAYEGADQYLAGVERGLKTAEEFIAKFEGLCGVAFASIGDGSFTRDNVARAIQINIERIEREKSTSLF